MYSEINRTIIEQDKEKKKIGKKTSGWSISKTFIKATEHMEIILDLI